MIMITIFDNRAALSQYLCFFLQGIFHSVFHVLLAAYAVTVRAASCASSVIISYDFRI